MRRCGVAAAWLMLAAPVLAASPGADFRPDPKSVQRYGPAYRYPQAGWIVLHVEGAPYDRGYQHGRLLAPEIAAYLRCCAALQSSRAPSDAWRHTRSLVNALFLRRFEREYLEEMKGIADGATAAGARLDGRPVDLVDVVALNVWPEIDTLDTALEATPTGLEGVRFPHPQPRAMPRPQEMHCSAFAATGPATADGKIVFGHITMFGLYPSLFFNVWLEVKPSAGHRVLMQTYPAGIQSGLDYYFNDAGLLVCETTLAQTRFDITGMSLGSRIRHALQYTDGIDGAVAFLQKGNNGLYTNEWLLADTKTNEIAMFELGTARSKLYRSSRGEWFGGTPGFYWGCNNTKDLAVRLETIPGVNARPANMVWRPSERDKTWQRLYAKHRGKIGVDFAREAFTTPPVAAYHSLDAKFTTTDLARDLKTWALFGPPLGRTWQPTREERQRFAEVRPMVSNPWTVLHAGPPTGRPAAGTVIADLFGNMEAAEDAAKADEDKSLPSVPAWHGTLLARTDADTWLAAAFAEYERIAAEERALHARATDGKLPPRDRDRLALALFGHRSGYQAAARAAGDVPLAQTRCAIADDGWYKVAAGKGVLLLHELRQVMGARAFDGMMEAFGRGHAGQPVTTAEFQAHVARAYGKPLDGFFEYWLRQPGLPVLHLESVTASSAPKGGYDVEGLVRREPPVPARLDMTVETAAGEETHTLALDGSSGRFHVHTAARPKRLVVDKYGWSVHANGGLFGVTSFLAELDRTLIVYGTADEAASNREAARSLQRAIVELWSNVTVPIKSDAEVTEAEVASRHLLLIGRPDCNRCVERCRGGLPVAFGSRSFVVRGESYAHPGSAVIAAAANPLNGRYSVVVLAGLSAESTARAPTLLLKRGQHSGDVVLLPAGRAPRGLVAPAPELVRELELSATKRLAGRH